MSKLVIFLIIVLTLVPIVVFLMFGDPKQPPTPLPDEILKEVVKQEPKPGDSPQCAMCRQIESSESQSQCLKDFMCSE